MRQEYAVALTKDNPELSIEHIQQKTAEHWESLDIDQKNEYQTRAKTLGIADDSLFIYECAWSNCEYQFEDLQDLMVHVMEGSHLVKSGMCGQL